jgi:hypothetical protein
MTMHHELSFRHWMTRLIVVATFLAALFALTPRPAAAQGYYVPPGGSPFSPYLDLYRRDTGLLNQYYNFVIPRRQLAQTLDQQRTAINRLETQVQSVRGQLRPAPTANIGPTGVGSGYMNYSHYYSGLPGGGR